MSKLPQWVKEELNKLHKGFTKKQRKRVAKAYFENRINLKKDTKCILARALGRRIGFDEGYREWHLDNHRRNSIYSDLEWYMMEHPKKLREYVKIVLYGL